MRKIDSKTGHLDQNPSLPIRIVSPDFGHLPPDQNPDNTETQRLPYYFLLFVLEGSCTQEVDLKKHELGPQELLFLLPHQIRDLSKGVQSTNYYKLGFDDECLARLPRQYPFLLDPLHRQQLRFPLSEALSLQTIFEMLRSLLSTPESDPELILAHLHSLLTEINCAYFKEARFQADGKLSKFTGFKVFVENNLTEHPSIRTIAAALAMSTDSLYQVVKQYSGQSPKEFITNRLILEAKRRMQYGQRSSVKELAYELGFNDPDYFSRLFRRVTGKTIAAFFEDLS